MITSVILHDIRSTHNVGAILRTCDGFGITRVYIGGYTPYPRIKNDPRLPHIADKLTRDIAKTALGAERALEIVLYSDLATLISSLKKQKILVTALEQSANTLNLRNAFTEARESLLIGREVEGVDAKYIAICDRIVEIPMSGTKESFNVSVATGIALYGLTNGS